MTKVQEVTPLVERYIIVRVYVRRHRDMSILDKLVVGNLVLNVEHQETMLGGLGEHG
jgi:hypothetical protein